jgi:hypothetical protein
MLVWSSLFLILGFSGILIACRKRSTEAFILAIFMLFGGYMGSAYTMGIGFQNYSKTIDYLNSDSMTVICQQQCTIDCAQKIIEQNERNNWIINAQLSKQKWGVFSLYPDLVMQLDRIAEGDK